jgi:uracil-DNA glycosylase family 4
VGYALPCNLHCDGCPLEGEDHVEKKVHSFVYDSRGRADLFIVAEAPGRDENERGEPMVGSAGKILWRLLENAGIDNCYIGNILRCQPPGNRDPKPEEVRTCIRHLYADLRKVRPRAVLMAGKTASNALLKSNKSAGKLRGWHDLHIPGRQRLTIPAYGSNHPSALHYDPDKQSTIETDLLRIARFLRGEKENTLKYKFRYANNLKRLDQAVRHTLRQKDCSIIFDWECVDLRRVNAHPLCVNWGWQVIPRKGDPYVLTYGVPLRHPKTPFGPEEYSQVEGRLSEFMLELRERNLDGLVELCAHGAKFDSCINQDVLGVKFPYFFCTQQGAHALDENRLKSGKSEGIFSLEALAIDWLGLSPDFWDGPTSDLLYSGQGDKCSVYDVTDHCGRDVAVTTSLRSEIDRRAEKQDYSGSLEKLSPLLESTSYLLSSMERNGMPVDMNMLSQLRSDKGPLLHRQKEIMDELHGLPSIQQTITEIRGGKGAIPLFANKERRTGFQMRRRVYLQKLFFDTLKIPWGKIKEQQTKTGLAKIDKDFFATFSEGISEVALVGEWRGLDKLISTYIEGWWNFVKDSPDGRIRASFNPTGTTTGRLSSSKPNLQQIPKGKTKAAKVIKKIFRPHNVPGCDDPLVIVACDLSQAEVRWLAEISEEPVLYAMYTKRASMLEDYSHNPSEALMQRIKLECDLHRSTAAEMFGIPIAEVTDDQRGGAKSITFGNIYGQTVYGLAAQLGIKVEEADALLKKWLGRFRKAGQWFDFTEDFAKKHGFVESPIGRRRHLDALLLGMAVHEGSALGHLLRVSRNAPIQSVASDMNLWIAIKIQRYIDKHNKPWLLEGLVHDSIIAEMPLSHVLKYVAVVKRIAENPTLLKALGVPKMVVPHEMEFEVGFSYGETQELTPAVVEQEEVIDGIEREWKAAA